VPPCVHPEEIARLRPDSASTWAVANVTNHREDTVAIDGVVPRDSRRFEQIRQGREIEAGRLLRPITVGVDDRDRAGRTAIASHSAAADGYVVDRSSRLSGTVKRWDFRSRVKTRY
jgi:hypothetical protein